MAPEYLRKQVERAVSQGAGVEVMSVAEKLREEGRKEGREKGRLDTAKHVALQLLKTGIGEGIILQSTGLSIAELEILKRELD